MLLIGTGSYEEYHNTPQEHYAYTVYFVAYWPTKESDNWNKGLKKKLDKNKRKRICNRKREVKMHFYFSFSIAT